MVRAHGMSIGEKPVLGGEMRTEQVGTGTVGTGLCLPLDPNLEDLGCLETIRWSISSLGLLA